jgi:hypothetical protein
MSTEAASGSAFGNPLILSAAIGSGVWLLEGSVYEVGTDRVVASNRPDRSLGSIEHLKQTGGIKKTLWCAAAF